MANHKSSVKRIRQTASRRLHNRYYAKTMRNAVRKLRATTDKAAASELLPKVQKMLDKLAKNNIIHKNKAGRGRDQRRRGGLQGHEVRRADQTEYAGDHRPDQGRSC